LKVNFGGFVPISTVDWRGRAVCTLFLRGCPVRCHYCHNKELQQGTDLRDLDEIIALIKSSRLAVSGVVFSGGEPTLQKDVLLALARAAHELSLAVGVQTNGVFPGTIHALLDEGLVDKVSLDIKARWEHYPNLMKTDPGCAEKIRNTLELCREAFRQGRLSEFEVVVTLFRGREDDVKYIAREADGVDFVIQQGVEGNIPPLSFEELRAIANPLGRPVKIRTREDGELILVNNQIIVADSIVLTDIAQARRAE
jgi:pyruvate formate lyase activating enzyme